MKLKRFSTILAFVAMTICTLYVLAEESQQELTLTEPVVAAADTPRAEPLPSPLPAAGDQEKLIKPEALWPDAESANVIFQAEEPGACDWGGSGTCEFCANEAQECRRACGRAHRGDKEGERTCFNDCIWDCNQCTIYYC